jgi:hypothetical protein
MRLIGRACLTRYSLVDGSPGAKKIACEDLVLVSSCLVWLVATEPVYPMGFFGGKCGCSEVKRGRARVIKAMLCSGSLWEGRTFRGAVFLGAKRYL